MTRKEWTTDEIIYLRENANEKTAEAIGDVLGRSRRSVQKKFNDLGLTKRLKPSEIGDVINGWEITEIYDKNIGKQYVKRAKVRSTLGDGKKSEYRLTQLTQGKVGWPDRRRPDASIRNKTHGLTDHRLYRIFNAMKSRCYNSNVSCYKDYGGRGISMCEAWKNDFMVFYNWAMENGYNDKLSIDREDNDGNYEPGNCRWATSKEQAFNKSCNIHVDIEAFGENKTVHEWIDDERCVLSKIGTLLYRIGAGWDAEKAITHESERYHVKNTFEELSKFLEQKYPKILKEFLSM